MVSRYHLQKNLIAFIEFCTCVVKKIKNKIYFGFSLPLLSERKNCSMKQTTIKYKSIKCMKRDIKIFENDLKIILL